MASRKLVDFQKPAAIALIFGSLYFFGGVEARLPNGVIALGDTYTVCTAPFPPYGNCTVGDQSLTNFKGYSAELFKKAAEQVGWASRNYAFRCLSYVDMLLDLTSPTGACDVATASIMIQQARIDQGINFGYPDYHGGQSLMVYATKETTNKWLFLAPFTWLVWFFLFLGALAVGLAIRVVEVILHARLPEEHREGACEARLLELLWHAGGQIVNATEPIKAMSLPSRVIMFVWAFLILLLVAMYTGNAAAILSASDVDVAFTSIYDLQGRTWGAYSETVNRLNLRGWFPTVLFDGNVTEENMLEQLKSGAIEGLVWDCGFVDYVSSTRCNFYKVGDCVARENRALAFWSNASDALVGNFSRAVLRLEEQEELDALHDRFIAPQSSYCETLAFGQSNKVTFKQVSGLWIVLSATIACAFVMAYVHRRMKLGAGKSRQITKSVGSGGLGSVSRRTGSQDQEEEVGTPSIDSKDRKSIDANV